MTKETMWPDPRRSHEITTCLLAECQRHNVLAIAGYDYLGYHLAVGVCCQSGSMYPASALYVRDPKGHGTKKTVEGPRLDVDAKVVIILTDPEGFPSP